MVVKLTLGEILDKLMASLDLDEITRSVLSDRFIAEGASFLCKTLPGLSKAIIRCVSLGWINNPDLPETMITGFRLRSGSRLPRILRLQLSRLFTRKGKLKKDYDPTALYEIRQLCEYFYKLAFDFSPDEREAAVRAYKDTENVIGYGVDYSWVDLLRKNLETYYDLKEPIDKILDTFRPRVTPGTYAGSSTSSYNRPHWAVQKRSRGNATTVPTGYKFTQRALKPAPRPWRLLTEGTRHIRGGLVSKPGEVSDILTRLNRESFYRAAVDSGLKPDWDMVVRLVPPVLVYESFCEVLFVPKDSRGPRVISKERLEYVRMQMSYFDYMVHKLERVTRGRVRFKDQELHKRLAKDGSCSGEWATCDLKEASDRVPLRVVQSLFRNLPIRHFLEWRSQLAILPDGSKCYMKKLAGMGSGLTFPTMALLIHLTISTAISINYRIPYKKAASLVYVYGDDVIVPTKYYAVVQSALERVGLLLNKDKSFAQGDFRESCGGDFLRGFDVTPLRLKLSSAGLPTMAECYKNGLLLEGLGLLQLERHCRLLVKAGLYDLAEYYYSAMERKLGSLPRVEGESPYFGRFEGLGLPDLCPTKSWKRPFRLQPMDAERARIRENNFKNWGFNLSQPLPAKENDCIPLSSNSLKAWVMRPVEEPFSDEEIGYRFARTRFYFNREVDQQYYLYDSLRAVRDDNSSERPPILGVSLPREGLLSKKLVNVDRLRTTEGTCTW